MTQNDLFTSEGHASHRLERFQLPDAMLDYWPEFYSQREADQLFEQLESELAWQQHHIQIAGLLRAQPRLSAWYGDAHARYSYSGLALQPHPWHPLLTQICQHIETQTQARFNSVLANLYRNQVDSMGWHSDDEPELGPRPLIASLSLGASREFLLRHKYIKTARHKLLLAHGSLLVMGGSMQEFWQHAIAKQTYQIGPRINLTFRLIHSK